MDLSPEELLCRKDTLKQFENYFENATSTLNKFVEQIGWTLDKTSINDILVKCPINSEHRILPSKLDVHCQSCILKQNGYDSTHSLYPSQTFSTSSAQTIKLDKITQMHILKSAYEESNFTLNMINETLVQDILQYFHNILQNKNIKQEPREISQSIERYSCDFTPDERRILYDSTVKITKLPNHDHVRNDLMNVDVFNKTDEKQKTELDILQEQRDLKRRRAAYRGKRVHTDRKSYVEVLREVIEGLTNSLSQQENKSIYVTTSNTNTETVSNNRVIYKYEGNRNDGCNPYIRWLDIKAEESKLLKHYDKKSDPLQETSTSRIHHLKDKTDIRKSRNSRSKSKERRKSNSELNLKRSGRCRSPLTFKDTKYINFKRSRTPLEFQETNSKRYKIRSKSKETMYRKSRKRSTSVESEHEKSKRIKYHSKSKKFRISRSRSVSMDSKHIRSKRSRTRSKEFNLSKEAKRSKSPINYFKSTLNENDPTVTFKLNNDHKKKDKHKKKRKHSKSHKKSHKSKKQL